MKGLWFPPNSSLEIPNVPVGNSVTWQAINDYGGLSQKYTANF
ncbi:fimbrial biogenesis chaperone [Ewingella americana]